MSNTDGKTLAAFSDELVNLVTRTTPGIAAVKGAAYRVVSGVAIGADLIAVSDHALKREERIGVVLGAGGETTANLVGRAPGIDLAVLRVQGATLSPLKQAQPTDLKTGALAAVVGFTADVGPSVSLGVIGALGGPRRTWKSGTLDQFIRLDVNLYPSQAGAAVIDMNGALIGIATPALSRHSAVAIPYSSLRRVADELVQSGRIRRGFLGVGVQPVAIPAALRGRAGIEAESGLMLLSVEPDGPAEHAGLQLGDILISLGGHPTPDIDDLQEALSGEAIDKDHEAVIVRGGEIARRQVRIRERNASKSGDRR
ncbi:MAG: trypsin-like peptidase domain-containing protein [Acidobacteriaceae bacterium]|nr:trypsin-like peptidase domain-containing protein [Acidobacteriaceae bacterium]